MSIQVTVDIVIFTIRDSRLKVLLIKRGIAPFKDCMAIPGGFVLEDESLDTAALRDSKKRPGWKTFFWSSYTALGSPSVILAAGW